MSIDHMKNASFSPSTDQDWKVKAEESLKGKKLESLNRTTYENIVLKPLYSKSDVSSFIGFPGKPDYRRGSQAFGYNSNPWKIAQKVSYQNQEQLSENLSIALEKGQTAISFSIKKELFNNIEHLKNMVSDLSKKAPFAIETDGQQKSFLDQFNEGQEVSGFIAEDPISILVYKGFLPLSIPEYMKSWAETINMANEKLPSVKTILIDTTPYHNGGANAVQELAVALATGVFYIEELKEKVELKLLFEKMIFKFQIGSNFFMELAKLRAARVLWNKIGEAYGIPTENRCMEIVSETSTFTKTVYDPHVNILRAGNEAFAAVLGGVQYLQVHSFNELDGITPLAERLARNTQLILKEEAFLQNIVDPAGGSWYIETLTNELIEKAWHYFLTIDEKGGLLTVLESNWLQTQISEVLSKRRLDTFTRKQTIVGTNVYANLQESYKGHSYGEGESSIRSEESGVFHKIQPIEPIRLSVPYEKMRQRSQHLIDIRVGLLCLGDLKDYKARADFMSGFLAAAGLNGVRSQGVKTFSDAKNFIQEKQVQHYVLCSSNDLYSEIGLNLLKQLTNEYPNITFFLAGLPNPDDQQQWMDLGIREFVHMKTNCYEFNSSILNELEEVGRSEE